jgi:hypothetical protein
MRKTKLSSEEYAGSQVAHERIVCFDDEGSRTANRPHDSRSVTVNDESAQPNNGPSVYHRPNKRAKVEDSARVKNVKLNNTLPLPLGEAFRCQLGAHFVNKPCAPQSPQNSSTRR